MLFKLFKHNTFIEYVSLCIAHKELTIQFNENEIVDLLRKQNTPYLKNIVRCNFIESASSLHSMTIYGYLGMYETIAPIKLSEVMSNKRKREVEAYQKSQKETLLSGVDWRDNHYYYPSGSTSYTATTNGNATTGYTYTVNYTGVPGSYDFVIR